MKIRMMLLPVVVVGALQLGGCGTDNTVQLSRGGTYISTSAGAFFDQSVTLADPTLTSIASFRLHSAHRPLFSPNEIYIAASQYGVVKTTNNGQSWTRISVPLASTRDVVALANGILVVSGTDTSGQGHILRSADEGKSWQQVYTVPVPVQTKRGGLLGSSKTSATPTVVLAIAPDPFNSERLYAGTSLGNILAGEQSGKTWHKLYSVGAGSVRDIIPSPHASGELLVMRSGGSMVRVSADELTRIIVPETLNDEGTGKGSRSMKSVDFVPSFPDALFVGVDNGAVISRDRGETWKELPIPVATRTDFNTVAVAVSPTNANRLLVGINDVVYRSEDGGDTWNTFSLGIGSFAITDLLISPANASHVLAITAPIST